MSVWLQDNFKKYLESLELKTWLLFARRGVGRETTTRDWHKVEKRWGIHPKTSLNAKRICDKYMSPCGCVEVDSESVATLLDISPNQASRIIANMIDRKIFKRVMVCDVSSGEINLPGKGHHSLLLNPRINFVVTHWKDLQKKEWLKEQYDMALLMGYKDWFRIRGERHYNRVRGTTL